jgi:hypothetical protein
MRTEFFAAISAIAAERGIPRERIIEQVEKHLNFTFSHICDLQVVESLKKLYIVETVASISVGKFELSL